MTLVLQPEEVADITNCIEGEMECARESLKSLTEPDERYEYNDTQLYISRLERLLCKVKQSH